MPQPALGRKRALIPGIVDLADRRLGVSGRELLAERAEPRSLERRSKLVTALVNSVLSARKIIAPPF
jgi:hypothetical protein